MVENLNKTITLSVTQTVRQLSDAYVALIKNNIPFKKFPSVMLWGPPGVGKSQGVRQIAERISESTGKKVNVTDVRLLLFNPIDLRGIPTANADKTLAVWLKPEIFRMDESKDVVNILFLDEISAAPQSVQASAYQITLDRTVGEHKLPENCIVIAAGNRVTDKSVAYTMPKALANRLCHIDVSSGSKSWKDWAINNGINKKVLGFIDYKPSALMEFQKVRDELAFPTPRSWEMVSNILNNVNEDIKAVFPLIVGCIGETAAYELRVWSEIYDKIPSVEEVFSGEACGVPTRPEALFAMCSQILSAVIRPHTQVEISNAVKYIASFPTEFKNKMFEDILKIKRIRKFLKEDYIFDEWFEESGRWWEDYEV